MIELIGQWFQEDPAGLFALPLLGVLFLLVAVLVLVRSFHQRIGQWLQEKPSRIPLGIGVLFLLVAVALLVNPVRLVMHGKIADGVVTNVVKHKSSRNTERKTKISTAATISFKAGNRNIVFNRTKTITEGWTCVAGCESYSKGQRVKIRYLADDPEIYEVDSFAALFVPSLPLGVMGAIFISIAMIARLTAIQQSQIGKGLLFVFPPIAGNAIAGLCIGAVFGYVYLTQLLSPEIIQSLGALFGLRLEFADVFWLAPLLGAIIGVICGIIACLVGVRR